MRNLIKLNTAVLVLVLVWTLLTGVASAASESLLNEGEYVGVHGEKEIFACMYYTNSDGNHVYNYTWRADGHDRRAYNVTLNDNKDIVRFDIVMYNMETGDPDCIYTFNSDGFGLLAQYKDGNIAFVTENKGGECKAHFYENKEYVGTEDLPLENLKGLPIYFTQMEMETYTLFDGSTAWGVFVNDGTALYLCSLASNGNFTVNDGYDNVVLSYTYDNNYYIQDGSWYCYEDGTVEEKKK